MRMRRPVVPATQFSPEITESEIKVSESAGRKMAELIQATDENVHGVRVYVAGGGCGGMSYGMTYAESESEYDRVLDGGEFKLYTDVVALQYLSGAEIDYVDDGIQATFVFHNVFQSVGGTGSCGGCGGAQ